ncbi:MAG: RsmD family RNA methyltransferase [Gemmatimonadetes bacterium]|nr:RsmD family RNA methyltransferase [Gemmatimonadota bacterium]
MRIIAGDYKGRKLKAPRRRARPSTDMVREACFSILGSEIVEADVLDALIARWHTTGAPMVAPRVAGRRANPVLFARRVWPDLLAVSGDSGGRPLFERYAGQVGWVDWPDDITPDIDTFEDYARLAGHGE